MMPERAYPPSGQILMMFGVILNDQPRDVLLQAIEALFPEAPTADPDIRRNRMAELAKRMTPIRRRQAEVGLNA